MLRITIICLMLMGTLSLYACSNQDNDNKDSVGTIYVATQPSEELEPPYPLKTLPKEILEDLMKHPELIPYEGVLGGTMHFIDSSYLIGEEKWVLATFEDGHINGQMLLQYTMKNNKISWKILAHKMD